MACRRYVVSGRTEEGAAGSGAPAADARWATSGPCFGSAFISYVLWVLPDGLLLNQSRGGFITYVLELDLT